MILAAVQMTPEHRNVERNRLVVLERFRTTEADIVCFPELSTTGYCFEQRDELLELAERPARSRFLDELATIARESSRSIAVGFAERDSSDRLFNSAALITSEGNLHIYRKLHLFYRESEVFEPGDRPLSVQQIDGVGVGLMICYDWRFPETARTLRLAGADVVLHPSNLVAPTELWWPVMATRAFENRVYTVTANRSGSESYDSEVLTFSGGSRIVDVSGRTLAEAPTATDQIIRKSVDPMRARKTSFNGINDIILDRRPEFYGTGPESAPASAADRMNMEKE